MKLSIWFLGLLSLCAPAPLLVAQEQYATIELTHDAPPFSVTIPAGFEPYAAPKGAAYGFRRSLADEHGNITSGFSVISFSLLDSPLAMSDINVNSSLPSVDLPVARKAIRITIAAPLNSPEPSIKTLTDCLSTLRAEVYMIEDLPAPAPNQDVEGGRFTQSLFFRPILFGFVAGLIFIFTRVFYRQWNKANV